MALKGTTCFKEEQDWAFKLPSFLILEWHIQCLQCCFDFDWLTSSWNCILGNIDLKSIHRGRHMNLQGGRNPQRTSSNRVRKATLESRMLPALWNLLYLSAVSCKPDSLSILNPSNGCKANSSWLRSSWGFLCIFHRPRNAVLHVKRYFQQLAGAVLCQMSPLEFICASKNIASGKNLPPNAWVGAI